MAKSKKNTVKPTLVPKRTFKKPTPVSSALEFSNFINCTLIKQYTLLAHVQTGFNTAHIVPINNQASIESLVEVLYCLNHASIMQKSAIELTRQLTREAQNKDLLQRAAGIAQITPHEYIKRRSGEIRVKYSNVFFSMLKASKLAYSVVENNPWLSRFDNHILDMRKHEEVINNQLLLLNYSFDSTAVSEWLADMGIKKELMSAMRPVKVWSAAPIRAAYKL